MRPRKYRARLILKEGLPVSVMIHLPDIEKDLIIGKRPFKFIFAVLRGGPNITKDDRDFDLFVFREL